MTARGRGARSVMFARDAPERAVALIPVDGELQAHSWDLTTGELVRTTAGHIRDPLITPDGQWIWWFDRATNELWRRPFAASARGRQERPLRLHPAPGTQVLVGGDGTAVVARAVPGAGIAISLLPIGRVRFGAEPILITQVPVVNSLCRSLDDDLLAVHTNELLVYRSHSAVLVAADQISERHEIISFTADGSILRAERSPEPASTGRGPITALTLWNPRTGLRRSLSLDAMSTPLSAAVTHNGRGILVAATLDGSSDGDTPGRVGAYLVPVDGSPAEFLGPAAGSLVPGTLTSAAGAYYGVWRDESSAQRLIAIEPKTLPGHSGYRPAVGGVG